MVMQMDAVECGAASLTMILAYYGRWLPLEEVRAACGVSRDGSSAKNIVEAAMGYGLEAKGYRATPEALEGMQPAIIHWNVDHFVVFRGFKHGAAYLNDPHAGPVTVPMEDFRRSFTGVVLSFSPTDHFQKGGHNTNIVSYIRQNLQGAREALTRCCRARTGTGPRRYSSPWAWWPFSSLCWYCCVCVMPSVWQAPCR